MICFFNDKRMKGQKDKMSKCQNVEMSKGQKVRVCDALNLNLTRPDFCFKKV